MATVDARSQAKTPRVVVRRTCPKLIRFSPDELARVVERALGLREVPGRLAPSEPHAEQRQYPENVQHRDNRTPRAASMDVGVPP